LKQHLYSTQQINIQKQSLHPTEIVCIRSAICDHQHHLVTTVTRARDYLIPPDAVPKQRSIERSEINWYGINNNSKPERTRNHRNEPVSIRSETKTNNYFDNAATASSSNTMPAKPSSVARSIGFSQSAETSSASIRFRKRSLEFRIILLPLLIASDDLAAAELV
jgi:hypothetical protein